MPVTRGINVMDIGGTAPDGVQQKVYRWATMSDSEIRNVVMPEDPEEPTEPIDPADPEDPTDPTDPIDPVDPVDPADPTDTGEEAEVTLDTVDQTGKTVTEFKRGQRVGLNLSGVAAGTSVTFEIHSDVVVLPVVAANDQGVAHTTWDVPSEFPLGEHNVVARYGDKSKNGVITILAAEDTDSQEQRGDGLSTSSPNDGTQENKSENQKVDAAAGKRRDRALATTGVDGWFMVMMAAVAVVGGISLMTLRRKSK